MFQAIRSFLGLEESSTSSDSDTEFSSIGTIETTDDGEDSDEILIEQRADFQRGDRVSFCPTGRQWVNAVVLKYRYPNNFTLKVEGTGRVYLGIKREDIRLPIKAVPSGRSLSYKKGEVIDVKRKRQIRSLEDARRAMEEDLAVENPNDKFDDSKWSQGQIIKVYHDPINSGAPPWFKVRFIKEDGTVEIDREVKESNVRKVFHKGDMVEVRAEGWAEYYRGRVIKKTAHRRYHVLIQEDGEIVKNCERVRMRAVGDFKDIVGKHVSDEYRAKRRKYTNYLKSGNFMRMLRMIENEGIHPDHEDPLSGRNALVQACLANQAKRAKQFVECGADVDYETLSGLTPLIACAEKGSVRCAKVILLDPWNRPLADPFRRNKLGKTAREVAVEHKRTRFIAFLDELTSKVDYNYARRRNAEIKMNDPSAVAAAAAAALKRLQHMAVVSQEMKEDAARKLQARFRGYLSRKHEKERLEREAREEVERKEKERLAGIKRFYFTIYATKLQRAYRSMIRYREQLERYRSNEAAKVITRFFRSLERRAEERRENAVRSLFNSTRHIRLIQNYILRFRQRQKFLRLKNAAIVCQCAWRCYVARNVFSELSERAWLEQRRRAHHHTIVTKLRKDTEDLWWYLRVEQAKQEWMAGNVLARSVRLYWFRVRRVSAADTIRRAWWCYRARCLKISLEKWAERTHLRLENSLLIHGLKPTYTMAPDGRKHPGLGVSRCRKSCLKCDCKEFDPAPQESMCTSPAGVPVCRCGHHMARHVYVSKQRGGDKLRLSWREKRAEALELPVTELLVRGLDRFDARREEYLRLRADVKKSAEKTDTRKLRRCGKFQLIKLKKKRAKEKNFRKEITIDSTPHSKSRPGEASKLNYMATLTSSIHSFADAMTTLDKEVSSGPPAIHDKHPDLVLRQLALSGTEVHLSLARRDPLYPEEKKEQAFKALEDESIRGPAPQAPNSMPPLPSCTVITTPTNTDETKTLSDSVPRSPWKKRLTFPAASPQTPQQSKQRKQKRYKRQKSQKMKPKRKEIDKREAAKFRVTSKNESASQVPDHPLFLQATPRLNIVRDDAHAGEHRKMRKQRKRKHSISNSLRRGKEKRLDKGQEEQPINKKSDSVRTSTVKSIGHNDLSPVAHQRKPKSPKTREHLSKVPNFKLNDDYQSVLKLIPLVSSGDDDEERERSAGMAQSKLDLKGMFFPIVENTSIRVGRAKSCEMTLDSVLFPKILSKQHATILFLRSRRQSHQGSENMDADRNENIVPVLVDTGSTNGTLVNGRKASRRKPVELRSGTVIVFGGKKSDLSYKVEICRL